MTLSTRYIVQRPGDYTWSDWDDLSDNKTQAEAVKDAQSRQIRPIRIVKREVTETVLSITEPVRHTEIK